jgi:hypothetical protein
MKKDAVEQSTLQAFLEAQRVPMLLGSILLFSICLIIFYKRNHHEPPENHTHISPRRNSEHESRHAIINPRPGGEQTHGPEASTAPLVWQFVP